MPTGPLCGLLEWDSDFFGFPVGRVLHPSLQPVDALRVASWAKRESVRCVYCLLDADDAASIRAVEQAGFRLVDERVELERSAGPVGGHGTFTGPDGVGLCRPEDVPALGALAGELHVQTRFFRDESFPRERCRALYQRWITNSCHGSADAVLVVRVDDNPVGYISCHLAQDAVGRIGLLGVAPDFQGRGLGLALVRSCIAWFVARGTRRIVTATQRHNRSMLRLLEKTGFHTSSVKLWWHLWPLGEIR